MSSRTKTANTIDALHHKYCFFQCWNCRWGVGRLNFLNYCFNPLNTLLNSVLGVIYIVYLYNMRRNFGRTLTDKKLNPS